MPVGTNSQLRSSMVATRPGFGGTEGPSRNEDIGTFDLGLKPLGPPITLVVLHESQREHCTSDSVEVCSLLGSAAEKRRNEFLLGRAASRLALIGAGLPNPSPVMQRAGRDPDWPDGIVGSITHCGPWAVAAVASSFRVRALGIDLECVASVPEMEISQSVCRASELQWVFEGRESQLRTAMLFSAKESVYKALYPRCQKFFDFHAVELTWTPQLAGFRGVLLSELSDEFRPGSRFEVHCQQRAQFVFTYLRINAAGSKSA